MNQMVKIRRLSLIMLIILCCEIFLPVFGQGKMFSSAAQPAAVFIEGAEPGGAKSNATPSDGAKIIATPVDGENASATPSCGAKTIATPSDSSKTIATPSDGAKPDARSADPESISYDRSLRMVRPGTPSEAEWMEVATFEELAAAMKRNRRIRLSDDITVSGVHYIMSSFEDPIHIDTGSHTIYVDGVAMVIGVTVTGTGGEGLFHVNEGGLLTLNGVTLTAEDGYVFWQEEGSGLIHNDLVLVEEGPRIPCSFSGEVHYAARPVAWYPEGGFNLGEGNLQPDPYYLFETGVPYDRSALPADVVAYWCDRGALNYGRLPVEWNTGENRENLEKRERTMLTGAYQENMVTLKTSEPKLLTVFQKENAGIWLTCEYWNNPTTPQVILKFLPDRPVRENGEFLLEVSVDGVEWTPLENVKISGPKNGIYTYKRYFHVWTGETVPQYYCIRIKNQETVSYSDIVMLSEEYTFARGDIDGTRGGGTELGEPEETVRPPLDDNFSDGSDGPVTGDNSGEPGTPPPNDSTGEPGTLPPNDSTGEPGTLPPNDSTGEPGTPPPNDSTGGPGTPQPNAPAEEPGVPQPNIPTEKPGTPQTNLPSGEPGIPQSNVPAEDPGVPQSNFLTEDPGDLQSGLPSEQSGNQLPGNKTLEESAPLVQKEAMESRDKHAAITERTHSGGITAAASGKTYSAPAPVETGAPFVAGRTGQLFAGWAALAGIVGLTLWFTMRGRKRKPDSKE